MGMYAECVNISFVLIKVVLFSLRIPHFVLDQVAKMDKEQAEMELQLKRLKHELHTAQVELNKTANQYKDAQNQIQTLSRERGMWVV